LGISKKIFLQGVSIIVCFAAVQVWVFLEVKGKLHSEMVRSIKSPVDLAYTLITEYDERVKRGSSAWKKPRRGPR
jgi:hypothetical protein